MRDSIILVRNRWLRSKHVVDWHSAVAWAGGDWKKAWEILQEWGWKWDEEKKEYDDSDVLETVYQAIFACMEIQGSFGYWVPSPEGEDGDIEIYGINFDWVEH